MPRLSQFNGSSWVEIAKNGTNGFDGSPDTAQDIVQKLTSLQKNEQLPYSAIKDAPEFKPQSSRDYAFTELTDTPKTYTDNTGKILKVNAAGTGVEFGISDGSDTLAYRMQSVWYIDPLTGNDDNSGLDASSALETWAEMRRRLGGPGATILGPVDIYIVSSLHDDDVMMLDFGVSDELLPAVIHGVPTVVRSGTITGYTNRNYATNTPNLLTDTGVADWSDDIMSGRMVKLTSGAASGYSSWVAKNLGGNQARMSTFYRASTDSEAQPAVNDTYDVIQLPLVRNYNLVPTLGDWTLDSIDLGGNDYTSTTYVRSATSGFVTLKNCQIYYLSQSGASVYYTNCGFFFPPFFQICFAGINAGMLYGPYGGAYVEAETGSDVFFGAGVLFQSVRLVTSNSGYSRVMDMGVFDATGSAFTCTTTGNLRLQKIWGSGNSAYGLDITASGAVIADFNLNKVVGTLGDARVRSTVYTWANLIVLGFVKDATSLAYLGPIV